MELIRTIALLCSFASEASPSEIDKQQLKCQKYYMDCMEAKRLDGTYKHLATCLRERKL